MLLDLPSLHPLLHCLLHLLQFPPGGQTGLLSYLSYLSLWVGFRSTVSWFLYSVPLDVSDSHLYHSQMSLGNQWQLPQLVDWNCNPPALHSGSPCLPSLLDFWTALISSTQDVTYISLPLAIMVDRYRQRFIPFVHYLVLSTKKNCWQTISAYQIIIWNNNKLMSITNPKSSRNVSSYVCRVSYDCFFITLCTYICPGTMP